ncbi:type VI secretion system ATPase TssH [Thalassococcus sp. S3]|uniref:type VI secretion system ATPase TssH n=1 Tax=Thalassococcus sp. S3 TaxID=2017482 RepID=UPI001024188B|nr:type VI secretion system ATPase TssH [Thalassococcus sp. S3]QBF32469.1 ClpV1 family T6SS ATPase [Thalassococcus sp. S3]
MSAIDLHVLISRLSPEVAVSLEQAAALAVRHAHASVELEHWLAVLCAGEAASTIEAAGSDPARAHAEAVRAVDSLPRQAGGTPSMSTAVIDLAREAWTAASLRFGQSRVSVELLLLTLVSDTGLRAQVRRVAPALLNLSLGALEEAVQAKAASLPSDNATPLPQASGGAEDFLSAYATDLTAEARAGHIDRIVGRETELRQMVDILLRRRQNNPILLGEAGVGKTAVVEAFAVMIADGDAPSPLKHVSVFALDLNLLQAGAGVKGEFERRLSGVLDQVRASETPIILFIDEAHSLIGAGGAAGQGDAANILKPALARGELRTIAATTWGEYKKHFEKDAALTRRFNPVKVAEPEIETAIRMLRAVAPKFQEHHGVPIRESALRAAVELSARYLPERQLPDKAVSVIDTAAAAVKLSREVTPDDLARHEIEARDLSVEIERLATEPPRAGLARDLRDLRRKLQTEEAEAAAISAKLTEQRALADAADQVAGEGGEDALQRLGALEKKLARAGGEAPLVHRVVDAEAVAAVIGRWTGVPTGRLMRSQIAAVGSLGDRIKSRVLGQDAAVDRICEAMRIAQAGLQDARRPQGVFLLVGMSGIGKTETALALADELYGGAQGLTVINMSEFKEEHKVSLLMGSPPGYVGYGEGGVLTEAVRRRPYSVLLLDEIDKAHPGVQEIFYQVFDKGVLRDGEGRDVDFRNTTILMTANTGSDTLATLAEDPETMPEPSELPDLLQADLSRDFKPAFLGRLSIVPYLPLNDATLAQIVELQLSKISERVRESYQAEMTVTDSARDLLAERARTGDTGARAIETMLARSVLPRLADFFLDSVASGMMPRAVEVGVDNEDGFSVAPVGKRRRLAS